MIVATTTSAEETQALGAAVADSMRSGDVLLLIGDMGAGKTTFVKGFGQAMAVDEPITSPTFVLLHTYHGRLPLHHADLYRLDQLEEIENLGIMELLDEGGIALIEWADRGLPAFSGDSLTVRCDYGCEPDIRRFTFEAEGAAWRSRLDELAESLQKWTKS